MIRRLVLVALLAAALAACLPRAARAVEVGDPKTALVHKLFTLFKKGGDDVASDAAVSTVKRSGRYAIDAGKALAKLQDDAAKVTGVLDASVRRVLKETDELVAGGAAYARAAKVVEAGGEMPVDAAVSMFEAADVLMRSQAAARKLAAEAGGEALEKLPALPQELERLHAAVLAHLAKLKGPKGKYRLFTQRNGNLMSVADNQRANELLLKVRRGGDLDAEELAVLQRAKMTDEPTTFQKALAQTHSRHGKGLKVKGGDVLEASTDIGKLVRAAARADKAAQKLLQKAFGKDTKTWFSLLYDVKAAVGESSREKLPLAARRMMDVLEQHKKAIAKAKELDPSYYPADHAFTGEMDDVLKQLRVFFKDPPAVSGDGAKFLSNHFTREARQAIDVLQHGSSNDIAKFLKEGARKNPEARASDTQAWCPRCNVITSLLSYYDSPLEKQMRLAVQRAADRGVLDKAVQHKIYDKTYDLFDGKDLAARANKKLLHRNGSPKAIPGVADDAHLLDDDVAMQLKNLDSDLAAAVKVTKRAHNQANDLAHDIGRHLGEKYPTVSSVVAKFDEAGAGMRGEYEQLFGAIKRHADAADEARQLNKGFTPPGVDTFGPDNVAAARKFFEDAAQ